MEEIKLTPEELKKAVDKGKFVAAGGFGSVFTYKGRLIKIDNRLFQLLKINDPIFTKQVILDRYKWGKDDFDNREQLEELNKRQSKIRTKVPSGIITIKDTDSRINDVIPGIIIPYFKGYERFDKVSRDDYKKILILLRKIYNDIRQLADNEITQEDLFTPPNERANRPHYNIIQKGNDPQIIDMSGAFIKVGKDFNGTDKMYSDFANLINYYNQINGLEQLYKNDPHITEDKLSIMLNEFEKQTKKR